MEEYRRKAQEGKSVFVGVDLHRFKWHVTARTEDMEPDLEMERAGSFGARSLWGVQCESVMSLRNETRRFHLQGDRLNTDTDGGSEHAAVEKCLTAATIVRFEGENLHPKV
jgi:hypothetical protein